MINCRYWQDLAQEITKWHFSLVEALPSSKFWKCDNDAISWTEWNTVMKFCIHIDIDRMYPMKLSNETWDLLSFFRGSNSEKSETIAKWHLSSVETLPSAKFWKSENGLISWTEWNILIDFCVNIDILKIQPNRLWNVIFHRSRFGRAPNSEKVKMALSLELSGILWWNFAYILVYWQDVAHFAPNSNSLHKVNSRLYFDEILQNHWYW